MKVLQLGKFYPIKGGVEKVMFDLTKGLSQRSIVCDMLCASEEETTEEKVVRLNEFSKIMIQPTWKEISKTKISPRLVIKLKKICRNYDIIHIHHPDPMAAVALLLSGFKGKVVLHWHSDILSQKNLLLFYKPIQNWILKKADVILTTTPTYLEQSADLQKYKFKTKIIPIGIDDVSTQYNPELCDKILDRHIGKKIIFSVGRLVNYKGFPYLIKAAHFLPDDFLIVIGGTGPLKQELQELIATEKLQSKVQLLGYLTDEELYSYYHVCDLFCLSSIEKTEAFAIVQIEAMAYGKPVVATNIPGSGVAWVNQNNFSGLNVPIKDSKSLADAFLRILNDAETYTKYRQGARIRFEQFFTKNIMINNCIEAYRFIFKEL